MLLKIRVKQISNYKNDEHIYICLVLQHSLNFDKIGFMNT